MLRALGCDYLHLVARIFANAAATCAEHVAAFPADVTAKAFHQ